jgi:hypothetical protein
MRQHQSVALLGILLAAFLAATPCRAGEAMDACVSSYVRAQKLRKAQNLRGASTELLACMFPRCPDELRRDCRRWLAEVQQETPSFIVEGHDELGREVPVRVRLDSERETHAGGESIHVNPGRHNIEVQSDGAARTSYRFVAHAGEKDRRLRVAVAPAVPREVWVLAGLGVLELGAATYFGLRAADLGDCGETCTAGDEEAAGTAKTAATISLGLAAVSLGAAGWLYFMRPWGRWSDVGGTRVGLRIDPRGSSVELSGHF